MDVKASVLCVVTRPIINAPLFSLKVLILIIRHVFNFLLGHHIP